MPSKPLDFAPAVFEAAMFEAAEFESAEEVEDDPLSQLPYTGDPEIDSAVELTAVKNAFADRAKAETARQKKATDSEYWICLCFQTREQVEAFLRATGWGAATAKYVDGRTVARGLGIDIPDDGAPFGRVNVDAKFAALTMD